MIAEDRCSGCERLCGCVCGCSEHSHFRHCVACAEDEHRDMLASLVPGDRRMREMGQLMDKAHRASLRRLGHPPWDDLDFRHLVAERLFHRLRAERWVSYLPGLAA